MILNFSERVFIDVSLIGQHESDRMPPLRKSLREVEHTHVAAEEIGGVHARQQHIDARRPVDEDEVPTRELAFVLDDLTVYGRDAEGRAERPPPPQQPP